MDQHSSNQQLSATPHNDYLGRRESLLASIGHMRGLGGSGNGSMTGLGMHGNLNMSGLGGVRSDSKHHRYCMVAKCRILSFSHPVAAICSLHLTNALLRRRVAGSVH